ncbi:DUF389 domain-containing protein [Caldimonas tepidiphila]|uniref:DUF389 domain-containing protein n=1 Tax=Caldimonas tepidiphila TaxID=2315841 RepID=UPI000E5B4A5E|nr:DUF389 domain-containing protein [Caldimonas tepidiphila]
MTRTVEIVLPSKHSGAVVERLQAMSGVMQVQLQPGASLTPPGDVIRLTVLGRALPQVVGWLDERGLLRGEGSSVSTQRPASVVSSPHLRALAHDSSEATWEEIDFMIVAESHMSANSLVNMACSGALASIGLLTDSLHVVIAAMVVAPGFEPLSRMGLGLGCGGHGLRRGLADVLKGYLALLAGALLAPLLMLAMDMLQLPMSGSAYLAQGSLLSYWVSISASSILVSLLAGVVGAIVLATHRSVLTAGVMIALALVPAAAMVSLGLVLGDPYLSAQGAKRWLLDALLVILTSGLVFGWKRWRIHRRGIVD